MFKHVHDYFRLDLERNQILIDGGIQEMDVTDSELNLNQIKYFLDEHFSILENHQTAFKRKETLKNRHSVCGHEGEFRNYSCVSQEDASQSSVPGRDKTVAQSMVRQRPVPVTPREQEKEKLIKELSVPKKRQALQNRALNRSLPPSTASCTTNDREREKDRLAAIFASSGYQFTKPTTHQISKNLNSGFYLDQPVRSGSPHSYLTTEERAVLSEQRTVPEILVSEYPKSSRTTKEQLTSGEGEMVRIGEYSPLNANRPTGKPVLGVGEYDGRKQMLIDQRRQEYHEYLQKQGQSRSPMPARDYSDHNPTSDNSPRLRTVATRTEWAGERQGIPSPGARERDCVSPGRLSPIPTCFEGLSEKELKEYLYREELRKQIEEKRRLQEEKRRREEEEEAKIEAKIRREQEEMKRQFEAERLQRLELAFRKKEQEELLRQRLAAEQQKALENKSKQRRQYKEKQSSQKPSQEPRVAPATTSACQALSDVHEVFKQPLLEIPGYQALDNYSHSPPERDVSPNITSALDKPAKPTRPLAPSPPIHRTKEVDMLVQKAAFNPSSRSVSQQTQEPPTSPPLPRERKREVDKLLRQPLLPDSHHVLPPVSPPLLHATIPPLSPSFQTSRARSPPVPASKRDNRPYSEILDDKWKVPYVEKYNATPADTVHTKHNRSVLTQLGAFRKHLQQERLRMQQRVLDDSP